jgi:hypothetical protein
MVIPAAAMASDAFVMGMCMGPPSLSVPAGWLNVQRAAVRLQRAKVPGAGPKGT